MTKPEAPTGNRTLSEHESKQLVARYGVPIAAVPIESYRLAVHPTLPSIPLFTLTGFLLAEGKAALRLLATWRNDPDAAEDTLSGWVDEHGPLML